MELERIEKHRSNTSVQKFFICILTLVLVCYFSACDGGEGGDDEGVQNANPAGTNDGSIGSSCGTCDAGLTCVTEVAGGYCTKTCNGPSECGTDAYCYNTESHGPVCLRACSYDSECREGYSCQGDADSTVCYPNQGGDTTPGGNYTNASVSGCYAQDGASITFRFWFDGQSNFQDVQYNPVSGDIVYSGTYVISGNQLTLQYYDDEPKVYTIAINSNGIILDDVGYHYSGEECN